MPQKNDILTTATASVDPAGQGVTVTLNSVTSPTLAQLGVGTVATAVAQDYTITLTTGTEVVSDTFTLKPWPHITLDPASGEQAETVVVDITGTDTEFGVNTTATTPPASGVTVTDFIVTDLTHAHATLEIDPTAPIGDIVLTVENAIDDKYAQAWFTVEEAVPEPSVTFDPAEVDSGSQDALIQATGVLTVFSAADTTVEVQGACAPAVTVHDVVVTDQTHLSFQVDVDLAAPLGPCEIAIITTGQAI